MCINCNLHFFACEFVFELGDVPAIAFLALLHELCVKVQRVNKSYKKLLYSTLRLVLNGK